MLKEIQSNAFISNNVIRPKIKFNEGLNVVNGSESGSNSIGKSTFLMAIDFCFGGDDYVEKLKNVVKNVGDHEINFAFEFAKEIKYFNRSTANPAIITICDESYNKTEESWSKNEFLKWLNIKYSNPTSLSFRQMVSLYLRVYNRENLSEMLPLRSFNNQTEAQSIEIILKLFDLFGPITESSKASKEAEEKKAAFSEAQKYNFIPKINKTQYNENLKKINDLEEQKKDLATKSEKGLLELTSSQAEIIGNLKEQLSIYKRQRSKLYNQLNIYKKDKEDNKESLTNDFDELRTFFPSLDINRLQEIENFHKSISSIMMAQVKESEKKTWNLINLLNIQIADIEKQINDVAQIKHVSIVTLEKYSSIDKDIERFKLENEKFQNLEELNKEVKEKGQKLNDDTMKQTSILEKTLNSKMTEINSFIFNGNENTPIFHIKTPKSYEFYTPEDDGTGTNFKGLVVMDISTLLTTALPILVHDSVLLKQISNESIEKIFEIYNNSKKQIFVSIDKETSYTNATIAIIKKCEVLKLSSGGNELYGFQFGKQGANQNDKL